MIGNDIEITIIEAAKDYVKLGIDAPKNISIHRKEIYLLIQEENKAAVNMNIRELKLFKR